MKATSTRASLDDIGIKYGTDKSSLGHDYLSNYEYYFRDRRDEELRILEIGVLNGSSLLTWAEYFPNASVVGVDIMPKERALTSERITIEVADQSNIEEMTRLAVKYGPFDLVVEDGSHMWEHQITSFKTVFPFVADGGIYITEDLQTNFGDLGSKFRGVSPLSFVDYIKKILDITVADDTLLERSAQDPFIKTYARSISNIVMFKRCCLLRKKVTISRSNQHLQRMIVPLKSELDLVIVAHIANVGDVVSHTNSISCAEKSFYIQGFSISSIPSDNVTMGYRARLEDGSWTDWAEEGRYVGTRGLSRPVTGIGIRLTAADGKMHHVNYYASFSNIKEVISAVDGSDCISKSLQPLQGFQVNIVRR